MSASATQMRRMLEMLERIDERLERLEATSAVTDEVMTTEDAAAFIGRSPRTLNNLSNGSAPQIACHRRGRRNYYRKSDLVAWLTANRRASQSEIDAVAGEFFH